MDNRLGFWSFVTVAYFLVCGGPFGIEYLVIHGGLLHSPRRSPHAAGPLATLAGLLLVPALWSVPQAFMTLAMASIFPKNGGYIVWIQVRSHGVAALTGRPPLGPRQAGWRPPTESAAV